MSDGVVLSQERFDVMMGECLALLAAEGFSQIPNDFPLRKIFRSGILEWMGVGAPPLSTVVPLRPNTLNQRRMDHLALRFALILSRYGVPHVSYNESLNGIRSEISRMLDAMGFARSEWCLVNFWGCYKLWEEVARADGKSQDEIAEIRQSYKEREREFFEES